MKKQEIKWIRKCPDCGCVIVYKYKTSYVAAKKENRLCKSCSKKGERNPAKRSDVRKKLSIKSSGENNSMYGKGHLIVGKNNGMYGKKHSKKTKQKMKKTDEQKKVLSEIRKKWFSNPENRKIFCVNMRESKKHKDYMLNNNPAHRPDIKKKKRLRFIKKITERCGQMAPGYNSNAIPIISEKAKEFGITDLQHAENGGEFHIKELGYWVDGYSPSKNIVIEYYENWHEKTIERDKQRKQEIIEYLRCKFIEIREGT